MGIAKNNSLTVRSPNRATFRMKFLLSNIYIQYMLNSMILFGHFPSQQSIERTQNIREKNKNKAHQQAYQNAWLPCINYKIIY